jgi:D-lactate dehydrogenase (cytochrome)
MKNSELVAVLRSALGAEQVLDDDKTRRYFSHDLFWSGKPPACVVVPRSVQEVATAVRLATTNGHPVVPRGGGMSYTGGYVADDENAVMFDTCKMNRVLAIDEENRQVTVEAGCTWITLYETLAAKGLRTPYWGPLSGKRATIGGTLSQNSVFFGSVRHGSAAESVLGIDAVLANGELLRTGAAARRDGQAFSRWGGPDLTGLLVGDAGSLGIKVTASFRLIPQPEVVGFGSYAFDDFAAMLRTQADLSRSGLGAEAFGIDAYKARNSAQTGKQLGEAAKTAAGVLKSGKSLLAGIKDVAGMALAGTSDLENAAYSLHLTVEGHDDAHITRQLAKIEALARANGGRTLPPIVPKGLRGRPFPPLRSALGVDGQRWVPVHGILPLGRIVAAVAEVEAMIAARQTDIDRLELFYSPLTTNVPNGVLFEPCFYWMDEVTDLHIDATELGSPPATWRDRSPREDRRTLAYELWLECARIMARHGAVNFQIGRVYPYLSNVDASYAELVRAIKRHLDPMNLMNPGALVGNRAS